MAMSKGLYSLPLFFEKKNTSQLVLGEELFCFMGLAIAVKEMRAGNEGAGPCGVLVKTRRSLQAPFNGIIRTLAFLDQITSDKPDSDIACPIVCVGSSC